MKFIVFAVYLLTLSFQVLSQTTEADERNIIISEYTQTFTYKMKDKNPIIEEINIIDYLCTKFKTSITVFDMYVAGNTIVDYINIKSKGRYTKPVHSFYFREGMINTDEKV